MFISISVCLPDYPHLSLFLLSPSFLFSPSLLTYLPTGTYLPTASTYLPCCPSSQTYPLLLPQYVKGLRFNAENTNI